MKLTYSVINLSVLLLFSFTSIYSQVAIGTVNPDDGSAFQIDSNTGSFVPPRMTNGQMLAIPTPLEGSMVYNTTTNSLHLRTNNIWKPFNTGATKSVVLNKTDGTLTLGTNTYYDFPLIATNSQSIDNSVFEITGNGEILVREAGVYMMTSSLSVQNNFPAGSRKYVLAIYRNGNLIGYPSRGFVDLPSNDWWGTSGTLMYNLQAGDVINFRYVINGTPGNTVNIGFANIGIFKTN